MTLKDALAKWPADIENPQPGELTARECDALVAVHVRGWFTDDALNGWHDDPPICLDTFKRLKDKWHPTTDRNDCAEAVATFALKEPVDGRNIPEQYPKCWMLQSTIESLTGLSIFREINTLLLHPSQICRAMLEALEESEERDA